MLVNIAYIVFGILGPYFIEQYVYSRSIPRQNEGHARVEQEYGWRLIWDAAYFIVFIAAGYRILMLDSQLSSFEWLGYLCFLVGVALRVWSLTQIGRFYNSGIAIQADHQFVRTGPYRFLRHPLHLGTLLQIAGLSVFSPVWLRLPAAFASLLLCLYLNRFEDLTHHRTLSAEFKDFYAKTWDLVDIFFWKRNLK